LIAEDSIVGVRGKAPAASTVNMAMVHIAISPSQFRPGPPPSLRSRKYAADLNEVALIGRDTSSLRNAYQTDTARFLTEHTQRMLNRAFRKLAVERGLSVPDAARLFAMTHAAAADGSIACYDAKYHYNLWRPIQALPGAEHDGNKRTAGRPVLASVHHHVAAPGVSFVAHLP
jgi:hypothetical protein